MNVINHKIVEIALDRVPGGDFERFVGVFYSAIGGIDLIPTGGTHDGGADAYQDTDVWQGRERPNAFYQASTQEDYRQKIRHTIRRLREVGRNPSSLVYVTSRVVEMPDRDEELLAAELDVNIKIRSRNWIVANINHSPRTVGAFETYLRPHLEFMREAGGASLITKLFQSRAVCVFLGQEVERRRNKSPLLESVVDTLILWALDKTDPDAGILMTRGEIIDKVEATFPASRQFLRGLIDARIKMLASKGNPTGREIRWYPKEKKACLPYEMRLIIQQENVDDEYLKTRVVEGFDLATQSLLRASGLEEPSSAAVANVVTNAIELTFENNGLELAAFLQDTAGTQQPLPISDNVDAALLKSDLKGAAALGIKLSNRMREDVFHDVMAKAREAFEIDDARAAVVMGTLSNRLKGDSFKQYEVSWSRGDRTILFG